MSSVNDIFGQIGVAKMFTGQVANSINSKKGLGKIVQKVNQGATNFLTNLAVYCDIGQRELIEWLADFLVYSLPAVEASCKAILLTNIKKSVACSMDARIPDIWRTEGVMINEKEIDPRMILETSPFSKYGKYNYFGTTKEVINDSKKGESSTGTVGLYTLCRAEDMNAFMWFTKNCANFVSPNIVCETSGDTLKRFFSHYVPSPEQGKIELQGTDTLYNRRYLISRENRRFIPGSTFKMSHNSNTIFMCTNGDIVKGLCEIKPVSNTWTSVNWYKNRQDFNKEKALFSLEYSNQYNQSAPIPKNNFVFKILPKPFKLSGCFITDIGANVTSVTNATKKIIVGKKDSNTDKSWEGWKSIKMTSALPHVARFNGNGVYDKGGKYSIDENKFYISQTGFLNDSKYLCYELRPKEGKNVYYLIFNESTKVFSLSSTEPSNNSGELSGNTNLNPGELSEVLTECYFGTTVYEFNYDYLSSFKLFDEKVIASNMVTALLNLDCLDFSRWFGLDNNPNTSEESIPGSNSYQTYINNYVNKLVERIISTEEKEFTDCFYTFSNQDYIDLENQTNDKLANGTLSVDTNPEIKRVYDILAAYNTDASKYEKVEVLKSIFVSALDEKIKDDSTKSDANPNSSSNLSTSNPNIGSSGKSFEDYLNFFVKFLTEQLVNAILSPNVLMLIQVNKKLMNNDPLTINQNYKFSVEDVLNGLSGTITSVVKEVVDMIQKELLRVILSSITQIMNSYLKELSFEYARKWVNLLKSLLACYNRNKNRVTGSANTNSFGNGSGFNSEIDNILNEGESIDFDMLKDQILPNTKDC